MLIFLDLETTGLGPQDQICACAMLFEDTFAYTLVNEGKKIPPQASAIHHITNEMIKDAKKFKQTQCYEYLKKYNTAQNILVGHNIAFDLSMLQKQGFVWQGEIIDTLRLSRHLLEDCESFSLQFLRYELRLYREEQRICSRYGIKDALVAHHALSDAVFVALLYEYHALGLNDSEMIALSHKRLHLQKIPFGKYRGRYFEEILYEDRAYLAWMYARSDIDEDLRSTLEHYLQGE
jgi:DNA polymerase III epsilon subunit-like protein